MAQRTKRRKTSSSNTTKGTSKRGGESGTTKTPNSYGYGKKSQTSVRSNYKIARKASFAPYASRYEYDIAKNLEERNIPFEHEPKKIEYLYPIRGGVCSSCLSSTVARRANYLPDFWLPDQEIWIEAKGLWQGSGRTKILAILETSGVIRTDNFRMIFQRDQWLTKARKQTYTMWCESHNIVSSVGTEIPESWTIK